MKVGLVNPDEWSPLIGGILRLCRYVTVVATAEPGRYMYDPHIRIGSTQNVHTCFLGTLLLVGVMALGSFLGFLGYCRVDTGSKR